MLEPESKNRTVKIRPKRLEIVFPFVEDVHANNNLPIEFSGIRKIEMTVFLNSMPSVSIVICLWHFFNL